MTDLEGDRLWDRSSRRDDASAWTDKSSRGMVVSAHYAATAAGVAILERGGSAADAVVATSLALAVCESAGSGLGGMAIALVREAGDGRVAVIPGACRAPAAATPEAVAAARSRYRGHRAVAVPGGVAVLRHLLATRGRLPLEVVAAPAIRLARDGYPLTALQTRLLEEYARPLRRAGAGSLFLDASGAVPRAGSPFRQPRLAATLERLAADGLDDFYTGSIARAIDADMRARGGFVRLADLEAASRPAEVEPLRGRLWDDAVASAGPPAGSLALLQMLAIASHLPALEEEPGTPGWCRAVADTIRRARRDRRRYRLRTGGEDPGEALELLDPERAAAAARETTDAAAGETSHLIAVDAEGGLVSMTQSIERSFGAGVAAGELGFLYNGYLRAFKLRNRRHPHFLRPGAPARSNAAPTLVLREGRPLATLGSTGSERMLSGIFQVLLRLRHQAPFAAVAAPRLHATPDRRVLWEAERFPRDAGRALRRAGYRLEALDAWSFKTGGLQLAVFGAGGEVTGVSEPRRDGAAAGPAPP